MANPQGIYTGLRVLELANENAMYCGKQLAIFGAEVIKIEQPGGDPSRYAGPFAGQIPNRETCLPFAFLNTGKKDLVLDLKTPEGQEIFHKLVKTADVVLETHTQVQAEALGTDYETLRALNPRIIVASVIPFGMKGPRSGWAANSDLIVDAVSGPMADMGEEGRPPLHLGYDILTYAASLYAVIAIQAAYRSCLQTGSGCLIDISQQECMLSWRSQRLGEALLTGQPPKRLGGENYVHQGPVRCKDGLAYLFIGGRWEALKAWMQEVGMDIEVLQDEKYLEHIYEVLTPWDQVLFDKIQELGSHYTKTEFMLEGQKRKLPTGTMETLDTLISNEHFIQRGFFQEIDHPVLGKLQYTSMPARFSEAAQVTGRPAPLLGADTEEILDQLGYDAPAREHLRAQGIV